MVEQESADADCKRKRPIRFFKFCDCKFKNDFWNSQIFKRKFLNSELKILFGHLNDEITKPNWQTSKTL